MRVVVDLVLSVVVSAVLIETSLLMGALFR